ncbi:MAG TPA: PQQ-dependent sugar dehydrogenase [Clostridia bacterium]|nr:PQQ-dependent sugar dehydrogenase [Clostridia bacterium]
MSASAQITFTDSGFVNEKVVGGFSTPIGFAFAPDGRVFVWERRGKIKVVKNGQVLATPFLDISSRVNNAGDRGLIGLALDPAFEVNGYIYISYVYEDGGDPTSTAPRTERVSRIQADPNNPDIALAGSELVILGTKNTLPCNPGEDCIVNEIAAHTVDHLAFGPDGMLYVSVGDGADYRSSTEGSLRAQDLNSLSGKLLRVTKDGAAPGDNPFDDQRNSVRSKVYSYGLRNPFRFSFGPNNELVIGDVGWSKWEEINFGRGKNFGWPCYEGGAPQSSFQSKFTLCQNLPVSAVTMPSYTYEHVTGIGGCVIMGPYLQRSPYPLQYENNIYFADFSNKWLKRANIDAAGQVTSVTTFATDLNDPVYLRQGPDGNLYWLSISSGSVYRIRYSGSNNRAPVAAASANPDSGASPLTVNFSSAGSSDPDGNPLTYLWEFGDGATSITPNPSHQYVATGVQKFAAKLTVTDTSGATDSAVVEITLGSSKPTVAITSPANNSTVDPDAVVAFSGGATDAEDGTIPDSGLLWSVILHHNTHTHLIKQATGSSGTFVADLPDTIDTYWYELSLQATDSAGSISTQSFRINLRYTPSGAPCPLKTTDPSVTICTPAEGATVTSPLRIVAGTTNSGGVTGMKVYVDGVGVFTTTATALDTTVPLSAGAHRITVKAWDALGRITSEVRNVTVGSGTGGTCTKSATDPSITVCSPANGATVASPVRFVALTTNSAGVTGMKIYVDGVSVFSTTAASIDTSLTLAAGTRRIVTKSWDKAGRVISDSRTVTVSGGGSACTKKTLDPSITVCSPANNATVKSPVRFVALTTNSAGVTGMKIYVDGVSVFSTTAASIDTSLTLAAGTRNVSIKSWDKAARVITEKLVINVSP